MKILHVAATYLPATRYGGPIVSVHGLCSALAARGHDVHVFTTSVDGPGDSDVPIGVPATVDGVKVWYFESTFLRRIYWSPQLGRALRDHIGDFAIAHLHAMFVWPTCAAGRAARRAGVPYLFAPRGMLERGLIERRSHRLKSAWIAWCDRANLEGAAGIHVTSPREAAEAKAFGFSLPAVHVIPNGVNLDEADGAPSEQVADAVRQAPYLLYLGRISWKKGLDRLLTALPYVPGVRLLVAGNDEERYTAALHEVAARAGVSDRAVFLGAVAGADKRVLLEGATILVLPSYSENFGNVVIEAMAQGCPVVVTPEVGCADIVQATGSGRVVEGDPQTLGPCLAALLGDPAARARMGEAGRASARAEYAWPSIAEKTEAVYENVLNSSRKRR